MRDNLFLLLPVTCRYYYRFSRNKNVLFPEIRDLYPVSSSDSLGKLLDLTRAGLIFGHLLFTGLFYSKYNLHILTGSARVYRI